jgi:hypothetical protein
MEEKQIVFFLGSLQRSMTKPTLDGRGHLLVSGFCSDYPRTGFRRHFVKTTCRLSFPKIILILFGLLKLCCAQLPDCPAADGVGKSGGHCCSSSHL